MLLPILREYLASDEARKDYDEWKAKKHENEDDSVDETEIERLK